MIAHFTVDGTVPEARAALLSLIEFNQRRCLTSRERHIIRLRFGFIGGDPHTVDEVGQLLGMSSERVRDVEVAGIHKMLARSHAEAEMRLEASGPDEVAVSTLMGSTDGARVTHRLNLAAEGEHCLVTVTSSDNAGESAQDYERLGRWLGAHVSMGRDAAAGPPIAVIDPHTLVGELLGGAPAAPCGVQ